MTTVRTQQMRHRRRGALVEDSTWVATPAAGRRNLLARVDALLVTIDEFEKRWKHA